MREVQNKTSVLATHFCSMSRGGDVYLALHNIMIIFKQLPLTLILSHGSRCVQIMIFYHYN